MGYLETVFEINEKIIQTTIKEISRTYPQLPRALVKNEAYKYLILTYADKHEKTDPNLVEFALEILCDSAKRKKYQNFPTSNLRETEKLFYPSILEVYLRERVLSDILKWSELTSQENEQFLHSVASDYSMELEDSFELQLLIRAEELAFPIIPQDITPLYDEIHVAIPNAEALLIKCTLTREMDGFFREVIITPETFIDREQFILFFLKIKKNMKLNLHEEDFIFEAMKIKQITIADFFRVLKEYCDKDAPLWSYINRAEKEKRVITFIEGFPVSFDIEHDHNIDEQKRAIEQSMKASVDSILQGEEITFPPVIKVIERLKNRKDEEINQLFKKAAEQFLKRQAEKKIPRFPSKVTLTTTVSSFDEAFLIHKRNKNIGPYTKFGKANEEKTLFQYLTNDNAAFKFSTLYDLISELLKYINDSEERFLAFQALTAYDNTGQTVVHRLIGFNREKESIFSSLDLIEKLAREFPALLNHQNAQGLTPLQYLLSGVCIKENSECSDNKVLYGLTEKKPFAYPYALFSLQDAIELVKRGADPNLCAFNHPPFLHVLGSLRSHSEVYRAIEYLINSGKVSIEAKDINGKTVFWYALNSKNIDNQLSIPCYLITQWGANHLAFNREGLTILDILALSIHEKWAQEVLKDLIKKHKLNINIRNRHNQTAFQTFMNSNNRHDGELALLFLKLGADFSVRNKFGYTFLEERVTALNSYNKTFIETVLEKQPILVSIMPSLLDRLIEKKNSLVMRDLFYLLDLGIKCNLSDYKLLPALLSKVNLNEDEILVKEFIERVQLNINAPIYYGQTLVEHLVLTTPIPINTLCVVQRLGANLNGIILPAFLSQGNFSDEFKEGVRTLVLQGGFCKYFRDYQLVETGESLNQLPLIIELYVFYYFLLKEYDTKALSRLARHLKKISVYAFQDIAMEALENFIRLNRGRDPSLSLRILHSALDDPIFKMPQFLLGRMLGFFTSSAIKKIHALIAEEEACNQLDSSLGWVDNLPAAYQ